MTQHFRILQSYNNLGFSLQTQFLTFRHVRNPIYILYQNPRITNALPGIAALKLIFSRTFRCTSLILGCRIVHTTIIKFFRTTVTNTRLTQVCQIFKYTDPHSCCSIIVSRKSIRHCIITIPQYLFCIFCSRKNSIGCNISTWGLLKELFA